MSDDDELSDSEREQLHDALLGLQQRLRQELAEEGERGEVVDLDLPIGRLSRMDAIQQQQMAKAERRRKEVRLTAVQTALQRYADDPDDFGWCARCGERIAWKRLLLRPESPWCVPCLEVREGR